MYVPGIVLFVLFVVLVWVSILERRSTKRRREREIAEELRHAREVFYEFCSIGRDARYTLGYQELLEQLIAATQAQVDVMRSPGDGDLRVELGYLKSLRYSLLQELEDESEGG